MKKIIKSFRLIVTLVISITIINNAAAQETDLSKIAANISNEGLSLYKSEWASWYGSDIFSEKCQNKRTLSGGYISYDTGKGLNNIFFSKGTDPEVIATITFGYDYNSNNYKLDTTTRKLTAIEKELHTIRQAAIADLYKDTLYKRYNNTSINPIPVINNNTKKVYLLTGPQSNGVVIFGNDYLLTFDKKNNLTDKKKLHKNLIAINYANTSGDTSKTTIGTIHSHLPETGDFITATDICTLMLYEKFTTWNQHIVISKNYVSIWDCKRNNLAILTKEAWDKVNVDENTLRNKPQ